MTIYKHIETPFGNFAASVAYDSDKKEYTYKSFTLTPLGSLAEVPIKQPSAREISPQPYIDQDALRAEGERQGSRTLYGTVGTPVYTINRSNYTEDVRVTFGEWAAQNHYDEKLHGTPRAIVFAGYPRNVLTAAARVKLEAWLLENRGLLLDDEVFIARSRVEHAQLEAYWRQRYEDDAREVLVKATEATIAAKATLGEAKYKLAVTMEGAR